MNRGTRFSNKRENNVEGKNEYPDTANCKKRNRVKTEKWGIVVFYVFVSPLFLNSGEINIILLIINVLTYI